MDVKRITLRIPDDVYHWIAGRAEKSTSTITAEIITILRLEMDGGYVREKDVRQIIQEELKNHDEAVKSV